VWLTGRRGDADAHLGCTRERIQYEIALDKVLTAMVLLRDQTNTGGQGWLYDARREVLNA